MPKILNDDIDYPKQYVVESFENRNFIKTLIPKGTALYRIVSKENPVNNVVGNNFIDGEFWIDDDAFIKISAGVNYDIPSKDITNLARHGLAITSKFSQTADSIVGITLMQDAYAWKGAAAGQLEVFKNGIKMVYQGGLTQLWIPNLTEKIVKFKFFHAI